MQAIAERQLPSTNAQMKATHEMHYGLQLLNVWKRFEGVAAVKNVTFQARRGEVHALLGENGAGKSTLMGIASGDLKPDEGTIEIAGQEAAQVTAKQAQNMGLAIVHQHPATLPDLTVTENMLLAVPSELRAGYASSNEWVMTQLKRVGSNIHPSTRLGDVSIAQCQLIELAKALAIEPKVLILDEPTAALTADLVDILFRNIRDAAARGATVIYISHRLKEIRQIADAATIMRDGEVKGSGRIDDLSDEQILNLIVGRAITDTYPAKSSGTAPMGRRLEVKGLSGSQFFNIHMTARSGEIVGIAGISGNGQSEFLRSLAGLVDASGEVTLDGGVVALGRPNAARKAGIVYLSPDRQKEGIFATLSVRENAAVSALSRFAHFGVINRKLERQNVQKQRTDLDIRAASIEQGITTLSGGNQQKTVVSRALLAQASLVLAEEPTAGVDVGARSEIYRILRDLASGGTPVVIVSSDSVELEGICDRVLVFSRGQVVAELSGRDVTEAKIGRSMVTATTDRRTVDAGKKSGETRRSYIRALAGSDYMPSIVLAGLVLLLAAIATYHNPRFITSFNIEKILFLASALAFAAYGQLCTILTGRIDLSIGPLIGLCLVIGSFFLNDGSTMGTIAAGFAAIVGAAALVGIINGSLVRFGNFTAVAATLGVYVTIQGVTLLLRPFPEGQIGSAVMETIKMTLGGIPIVFIIAVLLGILLEFALRATRWGMSIRAVGSNEKAAAYIGVNTGLTILGAFVTCSLFTALGGVVVIAQLGIGDPNQGVEYTLGSIAAVVLGGASLFGGRGSFLGVLLGAILIQEVNSSMVFLGLSQAWQYWFVGLLTLIAVTIYSQARGASAS